MRINWKNRKALETNKKAVLKIKKKMFKMRATRLLNDGTSLFMFYIFSRLAFKPKIIGTVTACASIIKKVRF